MCIEMEDMRSYHYSRFSNTMQEEATINTC